MKVLWTHNFDPDIKNSGNFMFQFANYLRNLGIDIELFYTGPLYKMKNVYKVRDKIAKISRKFDLVHAQFGSVCSFVTAGVQTKKIVSLRGSDWYKYQSYNLYSFLHSSLATSITRFAIKHYDAIITMSKRMSLEVKEKYPNYNVYTIPDPIDLDRFRPINKYYARNKMFSTNDKKLWVLFTTVSKKNGIKRIRLAQNAFKIASKDIKNIELKIAYDISHEQMPLFVPCCDVVLLTSTHEGWPNAIKEALACNVPFVSTDVSDLKDIARVEASCYVTNDNPNALAKCLVSSILQPRSKNLRKYVKSMGLPIIAEKLIEIYKRVIFFDSNEQSKQGINNLAVNLKLK